MGPEETDAIDAVWIEVEPEEPEPLFVRPVHRPTLTEESIYSLVSQQSRESLAPPPRLEESTRNTPVVPADNSIMTLPVEFATEKAAKAFSQTFHESFCHPTMRSGRLLYLLLPRIDFEGVCLLAVDNGGTILYSET